MISEGVGRRLSECFMQIRLLSRYMLIWNVTKQKTKPAKASWRTKHSEDDRVVFHKCIFPIPWRYETTFVYLQICTPKNCLCIWNESCNEITPALPQFERVFAWWRCCLLWNLSLVYMSFVSRIQLTSRCRGDPLTFAQIISPLSGQFRTSSLLSSFYPPLRVSASPSAVLAISLTGSFSCLISRSFSPCSLSPCLAVPA